MTTPTASSETHAPERNFVIPAVMNTIAESTAPVALKAMLRRQLRSRRRHQCTTIPLWDRVNARNTPTAYSGIRGAVLPPNET